MNKVKVISAICLCAGIAFAYLYSNQTEEYSDMVLSNVEALADDSEGNSQPYDCSFEGGVKCISGGYTKHVMLKIEDNWELF